MNVFEPVFSRWLPVVSILFIIYAVTALFIPGGTGNLISIAGSAAFFPLMLVGLKTAFRGTDIHLKAFFKRPANRATLFRSILVITGLILGAAGIAADVRWLRVTAVAAAVAGFSADFLDGWLARRERSKPKSAVWGPWFDAESDAMLLALTCIHLSFLEGVSSIILIPGLARYGFGLLFSIVPLSLQPPKWYALYSKGAAMLFQIVTAMLWSTILLSVGTPLFDRFIPLEVTFFVPAVTVIILSSFCIETGFRFALIRRGIPYGYGPGIIRSFIIYHRIPFRQLKMRRFYRRFLEKGSLVFDVGAHLGGRTRTFLELGAKVVAFEPQRSCQQLLSNWFGSEDRVRLDFSALGSEESQASLLISPGNPTLASLSRSWVEGIKTTPLFQRVVWSDEEETAVHTLDTAIETYGLPRFIKIDTEGFERQVIMGLSSPVDVISFEFLPVDKTAALECIELLERLARYRYSFSKAETMKLSLDSWMDAEGICRFIESYPETNRSGDIYAQLQA